MKFKIISRLSSALLLSLPTLAHGDVPGLDIIEVMFRHQKYYTYGIYYESGILKNHDLCYYDGQGNYVGEVTTFVKSSHRDTDSIDLYRSVDKLYIRKLIADFQPENAEDPNPFVEVFDGKIRVSAAEFLDHFILLDAYNSNISSASVYSNDLKKNDNVWIAKNNIELVFTLYEGTCEMDFFAIKGSLSKKEKKKIELELSRFLATNPDDEKWKKKLSALYRRRIIMFGSCSC